MDNGKTYYNLTHPQRRIWYIEKIYSNYPLNNIGGCLKINGASDFKILNRAMNEVIKLNEGLRLRIIEKDGEPYQYVADYKEQEIDYYDFSIFENPYDEYRNWSNSIYKEPFKFEDNPLYYIAMYKISEKESGILVKIHHIIADGWSVYYLLQKQVCEEYARLLNLKDIPRSKVYSYVDYIEKENKYIESDRFIKNKKYWLNKLENIPEQSLYSSSDNPKGNRISFDIDIKRAVALRRYLKDMEYSLNEFFTAILLIYLSRSNDSNDVTIGLPIFNRTGVKDKNTIGMYTSTMPLRIKLAQELTINDFIKHIRLELRECFRNQKYPYNLMVNDLGIAKRGFDSLFKISLNYYNISKSEGIGNITTELEECYSGYQSYSLQIIIKEWSGNDGIALDFDYRVSDYSDEYIVDIYRFLNNIIDQILFEDRRYVKDIKLLTLEDINNRVYTINSTKKYYPTNKTVYELFEEQVIRTPDKIAIINGEKSITYRVLNEKANGIANYLKTKGIAPGKVVGLMGDHSFELIIGILGVMKAGGACLPIDLNYPAERINYMLKDSQTSILLTNIELDSEIKFDGEIVHLNNEKILLSKENLTKINNPHDLAYIIYTSGSTGKPKGVMIEHMSLVNYIWWAKESYIRGGDVFAFYSSIAFDLTVTSIYTPLISGSTIAVYNDDGDEFVLYRILRENKATVVKLTPSHLSLIKDLDNMNSRIRRFVVGGENLKTSLAKDIYESFGGDIEIFNEYGPTEATVGCMIYKYCPEDTRDSVPIGKPACNTQIYILDQYFNILPNEIQGEMYISGDCLARGYLNNQEMTKERFVENPFVKGQVMYKTGDMAKYLKDGNIQYCGRRDNQVKIRGHRIELAEIEGWLLKNENIKDTVVVIKENSKENKHIYAYIISNKDISQRELNNWLTKLIPKYMIPSKFILLDEFPLTSNGKVDIKRLLDIDLDNKDEYIGSSNEIERELVKIMKKILMVETISMNDNFYRLGGDSIKAIQISSKLKDKGYNIKLKDILSNDTIEEIAATIEMSVINEEINQGLCKGDIEKTPIIEWFLSKNFNNINHFNQSVLLKLNNNISTSAIKQTLEAIIMHHDTLRLNYDHEENKLFYNEEHVSSDFNLYYYDLSNYSYKEKNNKIKEIGYKIKSSFDIKRDLLFKACIFKLSEEEQMILMTAHHLVIDGISWRIILEDFTTIIDKIMDKQEILTSPKTHSYKKWAENLLAYSINIQEEERVFWEEIDRYESNFNYNQKDLIKDSNTIFIQVEENLINSFSKKIKDIYSIELNEGLIIVLILTINNYTGLKDIVIELEQHGREEIDKEIDVTRTVGWFTSIYPAHFKVEQKELGSNIKSLKEQLRSIPSKGFNYSLLKYIRKQLSNKDKKHLRFNYLGNFDNIINTNLFQVLRMDSGLDIGENNYLTSIFDINAMIINKQLDISITYSNNDCTRDRVEKFVSMFINKIQDIISHCSEQDQIQFTASDFDGVEISQEDLDSLFM